MTEFLRDHTTFRIGGPARRWVEATTQSDLVEEVTRADAAGEPVLVLSGGSNVLVGDDGFDGVVIHVGLRGVDLNAAACSLDGPSCGGVLVEVAAGEPWDPFVAWCVERELLGLEALSGIPGYVGSTPIQNVGAYGQDVSQTLWSVHTWDRVTGRYRTFASADCRFGYRHSVFKDEPGRYLVLSVTFQLPQGDVASPVRYPELARALGVQVGERAPVAEVRAAVLALRRGKGMVLDEDDHDTWSAGSFFTNPIVTADVAAALPPDAPRFPAPEGRVKLSAAWLIGHAGFPRGYGTPPVTLSTKHTLALTNRGGARAADVVRLAREIRDGVADRFGVRLVPEPVLVGVSLD